MRIFDPGLQFGMAAFRIAGDIGDGPGRYFSSLRGCALTGLIR